MWDQAQERARERWGTCQNTYNEETKQLLYANRMGLRYCPDAETPYRFDLRGVSVLDIGGGPCSLLLKCDRVGAEIQYRDIIGICTSDGCDCRTLPYDRFVVVDPMPMPDWVRGRYTLAGIELIAIKAEDMCEEGFDECWIYNVLRYTEDQEKVIENAKKAGKLIRIFEQINTPPSIGYFQTLTEEKLNRWLGGKGKVERFASWAGRGASREITCYYGIFV